jgi:hypothetical protein
MDQEFDATKFAEQFDQGSLDGGLDQKLTKLTQDQLTEVALLLAAIIEGRMEESSWTLCARWLIFG